MTQSIYHGSHQDSGLRLVPLHFQEIYPLQSNSNYNKNTKTTYISLPQPLMTSWS